MTSLRTLLCISFALLLTACGFHPLYETHDGRRTVEPQLASVNVMSIADVPGQEMRNQILDMMPPTAPNPRYQLRINLNESSLGISIARDATVTRQQLRNNLHVELFDSKMQKIVWKSDMAATSGYNVLASELSNLIGEEDARKRNVDDLAQRVVEQLALYFERNPS